MGVAMTDLSTGLYAYGSVMAALWHRMKTGRGQHIDCNLLSTQVSCGFILCWNKALHKWSLNLILRFFIFEKKKKIKRVYKDVHYNSKILYQSV